MYRDFLFTRCLSFIFINFKMFLLIHCFKIKEIALLIIIKYLEVINVVLIVFLNFHY